MLSCAKLQIGLSLDKVQRVRVKISGYIPRILLTVSYTRRPSDAWITTSKLKVNYSILTCMLLLSAKMNQDTANDYLAETCSLYTNTEYLKSQYP